MSTRESDMHRTQLIDVFMDVLIDTAVTKVRDVDQRQYIKRLTTQSMLVGDILEELSKRNSRFCFIKKSLNEFLSEEFGLREAERSLDAVPVRRNYPVSRNENENEYLAMHMCDIVHTTIYELLDAFDFDLTVDQVPKVETTMYGACYLLETLYVKSKDLIPRPAMTNPPNTYHAPHSQKRNDYRYTNLLSPSNIRVLCIQPGPKESPIECRLEERSLGRDGVEETLSYVWGEPIFDRAIKIDGSSFAVTTNLYDILHSLRDEDVTRTIWVDAICINQLDLQEKSFQVRLMRDIYSKASRTNIWLGDWPPERMTSKLNLMENPDNILAPVPERFGGNLMDQYDLVSMLDEFRKYEIDAPWNERQFALNIMLIRCVNVIMMHEWWVRIWTIQEAALPSNEPIIYFRRYCFSYSTVMSALDASKEISRMSNERAKRFPEPDIALCKMLLALIHQAIHNDLNQGNAPFLRMLRPEKRIEWNKINPKDRTFPFILAQLTVYHATDPRDKIFAVESLLMRCAGRLINANYNEPIESVFRRTTARSLNLGPGNFISHYRLSVELNSGLNDDDTAPSWVRNFAYSSRNLHEQTLYGYLTNMDMQAPMHKPQDGPVIRLATPKTLFCSGIFTSIVYHTQPVPDLGPKATTLLQFVLDFRNYASQEWSKLVKAGRALQGQTHDSSKDNAVLARNGDEEQSIDSQAERSKEKYQIIGMLTDFLGEAWSKFTRVLIGGGETEPEYPFVFPEWGDVTRLLALGSIKWEGILKEMKNGVYPTETASSTFQGSAGAYLFIVNDGIVGLATAPVQEGDILSVTHGFPCYVVLRKVNDHGSGSQDVGKHRVVARAVITEKQSEMRARIDKNPQRCIFQII